MHYAAVGGQSEEARRERLKNAPNPLGPLEAGVLRQQDVRAGSAVHDPRWRRARTSGVSRRRPLNLPEADMTDTAQIERARLNVTLTLYAIARLIEAQATGDARFIVAAGALKQIAETTDQISDDTVCGSPPRKLSVKVF